REVPDLVQVVQLVLAARRLVEVPPAEAPGGVLHERPTEVARLGQRLAVNQLAQEPPQRRDRVVNAGRHRRRRAHLVDERFEELPPGRAPTPLEPRLQPLRSDAVEPAPPAQLYSRRGQVSAD